MSRRLARETALQVLFQLDITGEHNDLPLIINRWAEEFAVPESSIPFARKLVEGTLANKEAIDQKISAFAKDWSLERMAVVDRNLLRLSAFEILFCPDIPGRVTLNEAIELAKSFGGADSAKFINGILDKLTGDADKAQNKDNKPKENGKVQK